MKNLLIILLSIVSLSTKAQFCTTLSNGYTVNVPTHCCSGTYTNITINSDLYIDQNKSLTITGTITSNNGSHLYLDGTLTTSTTQTINGDLDINGGGGVANGRWITTGSSAHITLNGTSNLNGGGKIVCNGNFVNSGILNVNFNAILTIIKGATFSNTVTTDPTSVITIGTSGSPNGFTTTWSGTDHYLAGKVFDYNAVTVSAGYFELKCCKFRTGNFTFSGPTNAVTTPFTGYIEITGTGNGTNTLTGDAGISVYKAGSGSLNMGSATVLGVAKSPSPC